MSLADQDLKRTGGASAVLLGDDQKGQNSPGSIELSLGRRVRQLAELLQLKSFDGSSAENRDKERHRRVLLSAIVAALAKGISIATTLVSVPLTLHYLGSERYGLWLTMSSFIALLSFADLGIGNGLINAVAQAYGRNDRAEIRKLVSSAIFMLSAIALCIAAAIAIIFPYIPWDRLFNVHSPLAVQEVGPALAVLFACFILAIPAGIVQKTQIGLQQGFASSLWQCVGSLFTIVILLTAIYLKAGLPILVMAFAGAPLLASMLNTLVFFGFQARDIAPSAKYVSRSDAIRLVRIGFLFLVLHVVYAAQNCMDNIVIAQVLGASQVAQFAIPAQMFGLLTTILGFALFPLWPAYREAIERGDHAWARRTLVRSLKGSIALVAIASVALVLLAPSLLHLWVGETVNPPLVLLIGLGLWKVAEVAGMAMAMFLNGANIVRFQIIIGVLTAVAGLTLKIVFAKWIGISGVVWATVIAYSALTLLPYIIAFPSLYQKFALK